MTDDELIGRLLDAASEADFISLALETSDLWHLSYIALLYQETFGDVAGLADGTMRPKKTLLSYARTARIFPIDSRARWPGAAYSLFRIAAYSDDPEGWMDAATANGWSAARLRDEIRAKEGRRAPRATKGG